MNRADNHRELRRSVHGKIAIMPYTTFMKTFVPDPRVLEKRFRNCRTEVFNDMEPPKNEAEMYREIPKRLNQKERPCRGFVVVSTPHKGDSASSSIIAPDCGIYPREHAPQVVDATPYSWFYLEITIECKKDFGEDPFDVNPASSESFAKARKSALGQILSDAERVFQTQHRQHHFMIVFLGTFARLVRIDRSCVFATQRFNYVENEECLTEFLWRFSRLSPAQRGLDPTAERLNPKSTRDPWVRLMREKLKTATQAKVEPHILEAYRESLDDNVPWWKLQVCHEKADVPTFFLVGKPHFLAPGVRGRGTRGYIALPVLDDNTLGDFVYLKDAWRVKHEEIVQEGTTLEILNEKKVPHIPTLVCHGDLPDQLTTSRTMLMELFPKEKDECRITEYQHYRIVLEEIGKPLSQFKNSRELVRALCNVVEAHEGAYNHGIIHRDISGGNILLYKDSKGRWRGLLTDWELASDIHKTSHERLSERMGTWQFMSARVQNNFGRAVEIADELESVFHVLIFYTVRFCHHTIPKDDVGYFLYQYFDSHAEFFGGIRSSLMKRSSVEQGYIDLTTYTGVHRALRFVWPSKTADPNQVPNTNHPLNDIITRLLSWFQARYALNLVDFSTQAFPGDRRTDAINADLGDDEDDWSDSDASSDDDTDDDTGPLLDRQKIRKGAAKLATHRAMRRLLQKAIQKGKLWPAEYEKTKDQRPKAVFGWDRSPEAEVLPPAIRVCGVKCDDSQEPLEASQDSFVSASDETVEWEEPEENVDDEDVQDEDPLKKMEVENVGMQEESQTVGTLAEDDPEAPFTVGHGLPADAVPRSWTPPSPSYLLFSTTITSSRKRRHRDPDEPTAPTAPTKRSRLNN